MTRRRTHQDAIRSRTVTIRLTDAEYLRRTVDARAAGLSVSGLCERLITQGRVEVPPETRHRPMDPALFAELRRIGNNANQIAHAINSGLPPDAQFAWKTLRELLQVLMREEMFAQQFDALRKRTAANDPTSAQARNVFQRSVSVHPARSKDDFP